MSKKNKRLSNPFSTGGGGEQFEAQVQASFVVLMLSGGYAPCMPQCPIKKIMLQRKIDGYDTDDLIVFVENVGTRQQRKILIQIKHSISITEKDKVFGEVIQAAWNDFNNTNLFSKGKDAIALITGPLCASDINDVRTILEWARNVESADEFFKEVEQTNFSSLRKQQKLKAFKTNLKKANGGNPIPDEILFEFLKHFHLLGYDLDIKAGVTLSLLHSLIGQYSPENALLLWAQIVDEVQSANKNAGTLTPESLPEDLRTAFTRRIIATIPTELSVAQIPSAKPDWNRLAYASDLVVANLLGSWNENNEADRDVVRRLANKDFGPWISAIREVLQQPISPITLTNGEWRVTEREGLWQALGSRFFDDNLDRFRQCVVSVLTERDPQFDLPIGERFVASIRGKVLQHSPKLRKGLAESLALLGNKSDGLINCSQNKPKSVAALAVREIFARADWVLWGSLNDLLPILAEAAPDEFLNVVEAALQQSLCPFDELFSQEGDGIFGRNYFTGLLWALETLAWEEQFFVRVCTILGDLATHDPGGKLANRPAVSLTTILLPWLPQNTASIDKRKVALQTIQKQAPKVAWELLLKLLPSQHQVSSGTHKPSFRPAIPDDLGKVVKRQEYLEQVSFYAEQAVSMASDDLDKLNELVGYLGNLPQPSFDKVLELLSSEAVSSRPEGERVKLWESLMKVVSRNRRFSNANWALSSKAVLEIEEVASKLAPANPINLHRRLFSEQSSNHFEENGNWEEQLQRLKEHRQKAIKDILAYRGVEGVFEFAEAVESPFDVGYALGFVATLDTDAVILPASLGTERKKLAQFANGYVAGREYQYNWAWVDEVDRSGWSVMQISQLLSYLPFTDEAWNRAAFWLGDAEKEYWVRANVNPYLAHSELGLAIDKLIEFGRPNAAIHCLAEMNFDKQPIDKHRCVKALLAAVSSDEPSFMMDTYSIVELIKALQDKPDVDPEDLFGVEWAYLPLLDRDSDASPKLLENRLASSPDFFCEVIRIIYRSKKESEAKKEVSEKEKSIAENSWRLLNDWKTPPGMQPDGVFSREKFTVWLENVKESCTESGHLEVAFTHIGQVLVYCPPDPQGLWIDYTVADALNAKGADEMQNGFRIGLYNSRGIHGIDPTGKPERELADQYRQKADDVENAGYQRFAALLRRLAEEYDRDADRIVQEHNESDTGN